MKQTIKNKKVNYGKNFVHQNKYFLKLYFPVAGVCELKVEFLVNEESKFDSFNLRVLQKFEAYA